MSGHAETQQNPRLQDAFRRWGYLQAELDPLGRLKPQDHPELDCSSQAAERLREIYCGSVGAEFMHIPDPERRRWIQDRMEQEHSEPDRNWILRLLIRAALFEEFLQQRYLGNKRFSVEGVEALLPLLAEVLEAGSESGASRAILAMSHRGRLNVAHQIVGRPAVEILTGFEDTDPRSTLGGGDVKYHLGATGTYRPRSGSELAIHLVSNPSHLEAVDPVAMGRVRAWQTRLKEIEARQILPLQIHGDAAFAGQGILAETLNLADINGFSVGGTVHILVNNLIGFTAVPAQLHSSRFASDVAKRLSIPIFHVNAEDPDAVVRVARLASEYRFQFGSDVVVDLIGFRRWGHSEIDDPTITQPLLYGQIKSREPLWRSYGETAGIDPAPVENRIRKELTIAYEEARQVQVRPLMRELPPYWNRYQGGLYEENLEVDTGIDTPLLERLAERLTGYPADFHVHPKVVRLLGQRAEMGRGERPVDFAMGEALAFASLVAEGTPVRLSGQDSRRGTFNQRHAVLVDVENELRYCPLQHIQTDQAFFEVYDSVLSEAAVLGFEYGFSRDYPEALVLWEAQFGDFSNGAQVIIDQFITATEDKWKLLSGLVLLLPHGYEGQGPEHSSARLERFLQLAAEDNIQVCQPSTSAQYFHLLRRQVLRAWRKPLVVMTPKSMLRDLSAASPLADFTQPRFQTVVPDLEVQEATRVVVCSGKIGHELRQERQRREDWRTAIIFLEQFYPFPEEELRSAIRAHSTARELLWVQEEPANMGALFFVFPTLQRLAGHRAVRSIKRRASASPATGSSRAHQLEQKTLIERVFS